jgi:hypothetical protein
MNLNLINYYNPIIDPPDQNPEWCSASDDINSYINIMIGFLIFLVHFIFSKVLNR